MPRMSARNRLPGVITEVLKDEVSAKVSMQVGDNHVVSVITRESAEELDLREGQHVMAMVKATDVMVMTEDGDIA